MDIVRLIQGGESRILFESYTAENDINPENGKIGIRCHHWFTAFFMRIFGMITHIADNDGIVYHLNRKDFDSWRSRQAQALMIENENPNNLPSIQEIISRHNEVIQKELKAEQDQKNAALKAEQDQKADTLKAEREIKVKQVTQSSVTIQRGLRGQFVRELLPSLKFTRQELDGIKKEYASVENERESAKVKFIEEMGAFKDTVDSFRVKIDALEQELSTLNLDLPIKQEAQRALKSAIATRQAAKAKAEEVKANEQDGSAVAFIKDIFSIQTSPEIAELTAKIDNLSEEINSMQATVNAQESEIVALTQKAQNHELNISNYKNQMFHMETLSQETHTEHEKCLNEFQQRLDQALLALEKKNAEYDAILVKMSRPQQAVPEGPLGMKANEMPSGVNSKLVEEANRFLEKISETQAPPKAQLQPTQNVQSATENIYVEKMYADVKANAHGELVKLMQTIVKKFGAAAIQSWEFNSATGNFKIALKKTCKLWVRPRHDNGNPDSKTPKGVVILFGNNNTKSIEGRLDKNNSAINLTKGLTTYCEYSKSFGFLTKTGIADGTFNKIRYSSNGQIRVEAKGTDRGSGFGGSEVDEKKFDSMLRDWNEGIVPSDTQSHEGFLKAQPTKK